MFSHALVPHRMRPISTMAIIVGHHPTNPDTLYAWHDAWPQAITHTNADIRDAIVAIYLAPLGSVSVSSVPDATHEAPQFFWQPNGGSINMTGRNLFQIFPGAHAAAVAAGPNPTSVTQSSSTAVSSWLRGDYILAQVSETRTTNTTMLVAGQEIFMRPTTSSANLNSTRWTRGVQNNRRRLSGSPSTDNDSFWGWEPSQDYLDAINGTTGQAKHPDDFVYWGAHHAMPCRNMMHLKKSTSRCSVVCRLCYLRPSRHTKFKPLPPCNMCRTSRAVSRRTPPGATPPNLATSSRLITFHFSGSHRSHPLHIVCQSFQGPS